MSLPALQAPRPSALVAACSGALAASTSAPLLFRVPDDELDYFWHELDQEQQRFVNQTFACIEELHVAGNRKAKAVEIADRYLGQPKFSVKTLIEKHRLYVRGGYKSGVKRAENYVQAGDWKALVPNYWLPEKKYHQGFLDWLARHAGQYQRDQGDAAALRALKLEIWPAGHEPIPGYGTWRDEFRRRFPGEPLPAHCPPDFFPPGWSDRQLYRLLPEPAHMEIVRHGVAAAEDHFAQILNDRTKLHFGQIILIDDFWAPAKAQYKRSIDYLMGLAAMDWASGFWVHHAIMPREKLPDGTRKSLTARHMLWFVIGLLRALGLPRDRTITLLVENNTASLSTEAEELIRQTFQGRVIIRRSGLLNEKQGTVLEHGFRESGGKWRAYGKGNIESGFNLLKNEMSAMPGQRGSKERTNGHAAFGDMEKYAVTLLQNEALTEAHVEKLRLPFLSYADARVVTAQIFDRINGYTQHRCRGFAQVTEWRMSEKDDWTPYGAAATPEQQAAIAAGAQIITRTRPESRLERARRLRAEIQWTPIPEAAFIPLAAERAKPVTVTAKKQIVISRTGAAPWIFYSADAVRAGLLVPGKTYRGLILSEDHSAIFLTPMDSLQHLGTVPLFTGVDPTSQEEMAAAYAETCAPKRAVLARVRAVHQADNDQLGADRANNEIVRTAAEAGVTLQAAAEAQRVTSATVQRARQKRRSKVDQELAAAARLQAAAPAEPASGSLYDDLEEP